MSKAFSGAAPNDGRAFMTALRQAAQDQIARTQFRMTIGGRQVEAADRHTYH